MVLPSQPSAWHGYVTMSATKHANGVDWWIAITQRKTSICHTLLFDSTGVRQYKIDTLPNYIDYWGYPARLFSPDGSKFAKTTNNTVQLFDFDRCDATFSNERHDYFFGDSLNGSTGLGFSPNGRFMYLSAERALFQYDISKPDFGATKKRIATFDQYVDTVTQNLVFLSHMQLAPNGKIYIFGGWARIWHVIHNPDEEGAACNFEPNGLVLPTMNAPFPFQIPNYRLGALDPACGTIPPGDCAPQDSTSAQQWRVYPNPTSRYLKVAGPAQKMAVYRFQVFDALGRLLIEKQFDCLPDQVDLSSLPAAGYFYRILDAAGTQLARGKVLRMGE